MQVLNGNTTYPVHVCGAHTCCVCLDYFWVPNFRVLTFLSFKTDLDVRSLTQQAERLFSQGENLTVAPGPTFEFDIQITVRKIRKKETYEKLIYQKQDDDQLLLLLLMLCWLWRRRNLFLLAQPRRASLSLDQTIFRILLADRSLTQITLLTRKKDPLILSPTLFFFLLNW